MKRTRISKEKAKAKEGKWPLEVRKGQEINSLPESPEPCQHFDFRTNEV